MQIKGGIVGTPSVHVTMFLSQSIPADREEMRNITQKNCQRVGLAIAKRRLDCAVYPVEIRL